MNSEKKDFKGMNAAQKTEHLGFKIFSHKELQARQDKAVSRRTLGVKKFLGDIIGQEELELGKHMDEKALSKVFQDPINNFYDYAVSNDLTASDMEAIVDDIIQIAYMFKRTMNEANSEAMRLVYALTGENSVADVPLKEVMKITQVMKETRPQVVAEEFANEPSLADTVDEGIVDAEVPAPIVDDLAAGHAVEEAMQKEDEAKG